MSVIGRLGDLTRRRLQRRWAAPAGASRRPDPVGLAALRDEVIAERQAIDRRLAEIDRQLAARPPAVLAEVPDGSDLAWRPDLFTVPLPVPGFAGVASGVALGLDAKIFHDCSHSEITTRQASGRGRPHAAPFVLSLDVLAFQGSFLSLVVDLPDAATDQLTLSHVIQADLSIEAERDIEVFVRLNVKHGPNTEQVVREVDMREPTPVVEFDLAYTAMIENRIERAWLDVILGEPQMNRVVLSDLVISRRLRAEM